MALNIISLNCRGLAEGNKRRQVFNFYRKKCDILCLQETHSTSKTQTIWENEWGGKCLFSHGESNSRGVGIFFKRSLNIDISQIQKDEAGRMLACNLLFNECQFSLVVVYGPNKDSPGFFDNIVTNTGNLAVKKVIVGDINVVLKPELDANYPTTKSKAAKHVEQLMEDNLFTDVWRVRNPTKQRYSWYRTNPKLVASRLDIAIVSDGICDLIQDVFYLNGFKSDHSAMCVSIQPTTDDRGNGYWKFNTSLLHQKEAVLKLGETIQHSLHNYSKLSKRKQWECIKQELQKCAIEISRNCSKKREEEIAQLNLDITDLEENLNSISEEQKSTLQQKKFELQVKWEEKTAGVIFRSRCRWYEEGGKCTKYFYGLESAKYNAKTCRTLINDEGKEITDPIDILKLQKCYYENLYSKDCDVQFEKPEVEPENICDEITKKMHSEQFSMEELTQATKDLNNNKCPGPDGLPIEIYKFFWKLLRQPLYDAIIESYDCGQLHKSGTRGVLNLIPKGGKDVRFLKNLRPITLLNSDYKIIEKMIANRITPIFNQIIHEDQKGFLPKRQISINVRKIMDLINYTQKHDIPASILQIDFQKAFCSMESILEALRYFNISETIVKWVITLYTDFSVKVQNNGHFSESIRIEKSVHQGGPTSAIYFIAIAEILAISIRQDNRIRRIFMKDLETLLSQFADDTDMGIDAQNDTTISAIFQQLEWFQNMTGCKVNYDKTTVYRIGSIQQSSAKFYTENHLQWEEKRINVLGILVSNDVKAAVRANYEKIIDKMVSTLNSWKTRGLSLLRKITVINTLVGSLFIYPMSTLPDIPKDIIKIAEKHMEQFIWNGHKPKIPLKTLKMSKKQGGANLIDLETKNMAMKIKWIQHIINDEHTANAAHTLLNTPLGTMTWRCNISEKDVMKLVDASEDSFWTDVLHAWAKYNFTYDMEQDHIIWWNSLIKSADTPIYFESAAKLGLLRVSDLFKSGKMLNHHQCREKCGLSTMQYNILTTAIPRKCKAYVREQQKQGKELKDNGQNFLKMLNESATTKEIYVQLLPSSTSSATLRNKIKMECHQEISEEELCEQFKSLYITTNVPKFRSFQYRLLHRAVITNIHLHRWGKISSDSCSFCNIHHETYEHLFHLCPKIQPL